MRSIQPSKELIKRWYWTTVFYFSGLFLSSWFRIRNANPDPDTDPGIPLNPNPIRIHNTALVVKQGSCFYCNLRPSEKQQRLRKTSTSSSPNISKVRIHPSDILLLLSTVLLVPYVRFPKTDNEFKRNFALFFKLILQSIILWLLLPVLRIRDVYPGSGSGFFTAEKFFIEIILA
jgi:hypothetical protein